MLTSPDITLAESLNAIWKHHKLLKDIDAKELNDKINKLIIIWDKISKIETSRLANKAIEISNRHNLAIYDSLYVAICQTTNSPILTFDEDIIRKANNLEINLL